MKELQAMFVAVKITNAGAGVGQPHSFFRWRIPTESGTVIFDLKSQQ
jgi:hypothetical protein